MGRINMRHELKADYYSKESFLERAEFFKQDAEIETDPERKKVCFNLVNLYNERYQVTSLLMDRINKGELKCNRNGHDLPGKTDESLIVLATRDSWSCDDLLINLKENAHDFEIGTTGSHPCHKCGFERLPIKIVNGEIIVGDKCEYADGFPEYSIELDIPSGEMVIGNVLHKWFNYYETHPDEDRYSSRFCINQLHGRKIMSERQASIGTADFNIGNHACVMYQTDSAGEKFMIGADDDFDNGEEEIRMFPNHKIVGDVCTDYWGYYIVDRAELEKRAGPDEITEDECDYFREKGLHNIKIKSYEYGKFFVVKCKPGRYRFTHRYHLCGWKTGKDDKDIVFTNIEWIGN
jgi:hypothetical protein